MESPIQTQGRTVASRLRKLLGFSEDIPDGSESHNAVYLHSLGPKDCCSYVSHLLGHHCNQLPWRSRQTFLDKKKCGDLFHQIVWQMNQVNMIRINV